MSPTLSLSFPRKLVLTKPDHFKKVRREGERLRDGEIILFYLECGRPELQVGFTTSRGVGKAVYRNRTRRLMREVFRLHRHEIRTGFHYVFVWDGPVTGCSFRKTERMMLNLLERGGLLS